METQFIDAQKMHLENPKTFEVPTKKELSKIVKGSTVKVSIGSERFWNTVEKVENNKITAIVDNNLIHTDKHGYILGDNIEFNKSNIYQIY